MLNIREIKEKVIPVLKKHKIRRAGLFGSYAKEDAKEESDIDILIELPTNYSLLDFVGIKLELEDILGKNVDLVEYLALKPALKTTILNEEVIIYDRKALA